MPHKHPEDRIYTVMSGVFYIGLGDRFDGDKVKAYPPGSVIVLPGDTRHFHWAKSGEYVTQVTAIAIRAALLRPQSRGHVRLKSADPLKAPAIIQNFLATERDWQILRAGIRMAEEVGHQGALRPFVGKKLAPLARTDADLNAYIMQTGITVHHPLGTCKMGVPTDDLAVVDSNLSVFGTKQLRVVDASVMPDLMGGNINRGSYRRPSPQS